MEYNYILTCTLPMTQIFSITYRALSDITYNVAVYIPSSIIMYLYKRISIKKFIS